MRLSCAGVAAIFLSVFLAACSDGPAPSAAKKEIAPPPEPISGRQAIQYMAGSARIWAADAQPLTLRSVQVEGVTAEPGKAGAWEVMFTSQASGGARPYTWSAVDLEDVHIHKGIFPGPQETWRADGSQQPFSAAEIRVDSGEALQAATKEGAAYLDKPGTKPAVNYLLEFNKAERYQNPVWRVMWGGSMSSADYVVTVDAITGKVLAR